MIAITGVEHTPAFGTLDGLLVVDLLGDDDIAIQERSKRHCHHYRSTSIA
jgi:hypothetical protein